MEQEIDVSFSCESDIPDLNQLSYQKRRFYEKAQPTFWKWKGEAGEKAQQSWFKKLLEDDHHICLTAKKADQIVGFIIGKIIEAPSVYNPGGLTLMVDDFCTTEDKWSTIGAALISKIKNIARGRGVTQIIVVSGSHDFYKKEFLTKADLSCASQWYVGSVASVDEERR